MTVYVFYLSGPSPAEDEPFLDLIVIDAMCHW